MADGAHGELEAPMKNGALDPLEFAGNRAPGDGRNAQFRALENFVNAEGSTMVEDPTENLEDAETFEELSESSEDVQNSKTMGVEKGNTDFPACFILANTTIPEKILNDSNRNVLLPLNKNSSPASDQEKMSNITIRNTLNKEPNCPTTNAVEIIKLKMKGGMEEKGQERRRECGGLHDSEMDMKSQTEIPNAFKSVEEGGEKLFYENIDEEIISFYNDCKENDDFSESDETLSTHGEFQLRNEKKMNPHATSTGEGSEKNEGGGYYQNMKMNEWISGNHVIENDNSNSNINSFELKSPSGKYVEVTSQALEKARAFFKDGKRKLDNFNQLHGGNEKKQAFTSLSPKIKSGSGKNSTLSSESMKKIKIPFKLEGCEEDYTSSILNRSQDRNLMRHIESANSNCFGVKSVSGKRFTVSNESIKKSRRILGENDFNLGQDPELSFPDLNPNTIQNQMIDLDARISTSFSGFKSASGKNLTVSSKSIEKARSLLGEENGRCIPLDFSDQNQNVEPQHKLQNGLKENGSTCFPGFEPASAKNPTISSKNFDSAKRIFSEDSDANLDRVTSSAFEGGSFGFKSASGKNLSVSLESIMKAKRIFGEENDPTFASNFPGQNHHKERCVDVKNSNHFSGFKTGSGKNLTLSSESIEKAKTLFDDKSDENVSPKFLSHSQFQSPYQNPNAKSVGNLLGFKSASGKNVSISTESIAKVRKMFDDDENNENTNIPREKNSHPSKVEYNAHSRCGAMKHEDGNPHFSNRNRFNHRKNGVRVLKNSTNIPNTSSNRTTSSGSRKFKFKSPRLIPKKLSENLMDSPCTPPTENYLSSNKSEINSSKTSFEEFIGRPVVMNFEKMGLNSNSTDGAITLNSSKLQVFSSNISEDIGYQHMQKMLILAGADENFATKEWTKNHYRWILWKSFLYDKHFSSSIGRKFSSVENVLNQLKFRYEWEINNGKRSVLRKITERDFSPKNPMVVFVSKIVEKGTINNSIVQSSNLIPETRLTNDYLGRTRKSWEQDSNYTKMDNETLKAENCKPAIVEVTDGWYPLLATLDSKLSEYVRSGKIFVGQKLLICGSSLEGCSEGLPPLEAYNSMHLSINYNGTYRAMWFQKLGYYKEKYLPLKFSLISEAGGKVPLTVFTILRKYPVLYYEKLENGNGIMRSARAESIASKKFEEMRDKIIEETSLKLEGESKMFDVPKKRGKISRNDASDDQRRLFFEFQTSNDKEYFFESLNDEKKHMILKQQQIEEENSLRHLEDKIKSNLQAKNLLSRTVIPLLRVRVCSLISNPRASTVDEVSHTHSLKCIDQRGINAFEFGTSVKEVGSDGLRKLDLKIRKKDECRIGEAEKQDEGRDNGFKREKECDLNVRGIERNGPIGVVLQEDMMGRKCLRERKLDRTENNDGMENGNHKYKEEKTNEDELVKKNVGSKDEIIHQRDEMSTENHLLEDKNRETEGIVTIWKPSEDQCNEIKEGEHYLVSNLFPINKYNLNCEKIINLNSTQFSKWRRLNEKSKSNFKSLFRPRKAMLLKHMSNHLFGKEFDFVGLVIKVGQPFSYGSKISQWMFLIDGSVEPAGMSMLEHNGLPQSDAIPSPILGIQITSTSDAFVPYESHLENTTVSWCNLTLKSIDQKNRVWNSEAFDVSLMSSTIFSHLSQGAHDVSEWAASNQNVVRKLTEYIEGIL